MNKTVDDNKIILVTGATDGIGRIAAELLARKGAVVVLHGRDAEKCRAVREDIGRKSGSGRLECVTADFAALSAVRRMAADVGERHGRLDVLINNAGVLPVDSEERRRFSADGYDMCMAVNYLAPFLLTHLLLPLLRASNGARIVNVSSVAQEPVDFENLMLAED